MTKRLLLLALPALLAGCPASPPPPDAARASAPAKDDAAATPPPQQTKEDGFASPGTIRAASLLPKRQWRLVSAVDSAGRPIAALTARPAHPVTLDFRDGELHVGNTCNHMRGDYAPKGGSLVIEKLVATEIACADAVLTALDTEVGKRLDGALGLRMSKNDATQLELKTASGDTLLFQGGPDGAAPKPAAEAKR